MANYIDDAQILLNVDKLLFAEDLIHCVFAFTLPEYTYTRSNVEHSRHLLENSFNDSMKDAIEIIIEDHLENYYKEFVNMQNMGRINLEYFTEYANNHRPFTDEFQAAYFLMYCARVATMSVYFLSEGMCNAPDIAIDQIVRAIPGGYLSRDFWNSLKDAAERYVRSKWDSLNLDTPSDSDASSD